jgi:hypothetical protein
MTGLMTILSGRLVLFIGKLFKAARLKIHANFHENIENVFECVIL